MATSSSASDVVAASWVDVNVGLARGLGETLKRLLPTLAGAFGLQALYVVTSYPDSSLVAELVFLNGLSAAVAWLGSREAKKGAIAITVENVAAALIALTVAVEVLHVWLLGEIGFTLALVAAQLAAGFLISRSVVLWPLLIGSSAAWFFVVIGQQPLARWIPLAFAVVLTCRWSIRISSSRIAEALAHSDGEQLTAEQRRQRDLEEIDRVERRERERHAIRSAGDGHWYWDLLEDKFQFSSGWAELLGFEEGEIGDTPDEFFDRIHAHYLPQVKEDLSAHIYGKLPRLQCQFRMQHRDGSYIWALLRGAVERDQDDNAIVVSGSLVDVTHLVQTEKTIIDDAFQDRLTGLPNRKALTVRLKRAVDQMRREPTLFAVIFLDLDRFKIINDSHGHLVGDQLLAAAASRVRACLRLRTGDILARFGGDEFVALLEDLRTAEDAIVIASRFQKALQKPFQIGSHEIVSGGSIGIAFNNTEIKTAEDLLSNADTAMYKAKARGKGELQVFNSEMHKEATRAYALENDLGLALSRNEFFLEYQPVVSMASCEIVGAEALVRWQRSPNEVVSPGEFIALAEETGNIEMIGEWVLREAVEQNARWQKLGLAPIRVAVNVSAKQLRSRDFPKMVVEILAASQLDPSWLELELTETALMANLDEAAATIEVLQNAGIRISIDDFGTGYSSLGYLRRFSFNCLKMDRSFVADLTEDPKSLAVAQGLVSLAHNLLLKVTAEGVETQEQLNVLRHYGCDQFQGFLASRPQRAAEFAELLGNGPYTALLDASRSAEQVGVLF